MNFEWTEVSDGQSDWRYLLESNVFCGCGHSISWITSEAPNPVI